MSRVSRRGVVMLSAVSIGALSFGIWGRLFGRKRLRFPYLSGALSPQEYQALAEKPGWSKSQVEVAAGIRLNGLVRRPAAPDAPWVIFYQGNDAAMLRVGQAFLTRLGADQPWGLAIYAYRGYDSSAGVPRLSELSLDAPEIVERLCAAEQVDPSRVHLVGFSIGGHLAVRAMAALARSTPKPASLTLLAAVDDIVMVPRSFYDRLDPGDDFQTRPLLSQIPAPVLVVQGTADEALGGPEQGRALAKALGERARYVELPGVGHTALLENEQALGLVREFIANHS